jgi:hypothetical protein
MKQLSIFLLVIFASSFGYSQEDELPENLGDNFSLEGALALFKQVNTLSAFEQAINQENNNVNNLDLNNDGAIDYITVTDLYENNGHSIVLSIDINETEKQDVATINIEKTGNDNAILQIEGDQDLYAANTIVEPFDTIEKQKNTKGGGPAVSDLLINRIVINVWFWPCVQSIYAPAYVVYASPHRWGYYPVWFKPWRPFRHQMFYANCAPHRQFFGYTTVRRMNKAHNFYAPKRRSTTILFNNNKRAKAYRNYSRKQNIGKSNRQNNVQEKNHFRGRRR